ncbi:glycoside hydrolase family protein [Saccharicrinis fermentans]|uniref:Beta-xylosidase n=1 Tax=Saccharicrinis fermentans DSM 9555 = JCM 21142 TaxID=869213 RepID=W7YB62_9BACT|nr:glycoside hydrolase family protein [Saccharicrinis fermentans]GAF01621.1 beta-xylosidase [Saccharicrinis fermentans DSM 9555 = JCM 21142]
MNSARILFSTLLLCFIVFISCQDKGTKKNAGSKAQHTEASWEGPTAIADHWKLIGEAVNEPGYDIWGSSPIRDEQGNVHLFCARWSSEEPFKIAWRFNSEIAHYVSKSPEGPFRFVEVVGKGRGNDRWNSAGFHNPSIKKIDDKYVLVYIANDGAKQHGPNQRIGMMVSDDINGPWTDIPNRNMPLLSPPTDSTIWCFNSGLGVNNPSIIKHPNGKYHLYFKALSGPRPKGKVSMGVAIANKLEGPYIIQANPIISNEVRIEDGYAFLWRNHICLLTTDNHGILEKGGGLLWVSEDGITFEAEPLSGFHNCQNFYLNGIVPDGAKARYGKNVKFERPQLLMDGNNELEYLYCPSGVALDGSDGTNSYVLKYQK